MNYRILFSALGAALMLAGCGDSERFRAGEYRQHEMVYHFDRNGSGFRTVDKLTEQNFAWQLEERDRIVVMLPTSRERFRVIDEATIARQDDRYFNLEGYKRAARPRYPATN